ncbi:Protein LURP-one-related 11 [Ananas comosus]|uniref:Protein LURP-one-related 11 n=1 Tax=Ananas comosus TaxID=4615 RepID=A0A199V5H5_ANACO|nr:Protein LURP-one-related 11 [Ananas comosus]
MAKVHPSFSSSSSSSTCCYRSAKREVFTIWMKSLVLNGNGCTVYDSKGQIIFRVDNYDCKGSGKVYLMDISGKVLFKILKKKLFFGRWEGYKWNGLHQEANPWFKVKKPCRIFKGSSEQPYCEIWSKSGQLLCYKIDGFSRKSSPYKIVDNSSGLVVAEAKRKQTSSGVALGDDVFSLVVEPNIDHSLIMGLVIVHGLMNHIL